MDINIFLLCYNESALLPHTIKHYKKYLPSCKITVFDNKSTDNSVEIARSLGCICIDFTTYNRADEFMQRDLKNNCWKYITSGWIIVADMDEFLCVTEDELLEEMNSGTSILLVKGIDIIGESETTDLSDIDLQKINKYVDNTVENKHLCFLREKIIDMHYEPGAHVCHPIGMGKVSSKIYINKHMSNLGLPYLTNKMITRYERTEWMRTMNMDTHYTNNIEHIHNNYMKLLDICKIL